MNFKEIMNTISKENKDRFASRLASAPVKRFQILLCQFIKIHVFFWTRLGRILGRLLCVFNARPIAALSLVAPASTSFDRHCYAVSAYNRPVF
jgi:hypothetical protein